MAVVIPIVFTTVWVTLIFWGRLSEDWEFLSLYVSCWAWFLYILWAFGK
jgi:hypothetical protein